MPGPDVSDPDVIVLGAGAAGLMCALTAAARGRRVVVLDHAPDPGGKILVSGGGRCNFTNVNAAPDRYLSANPRFATSALKRFGAAAFVEMVRKHHIAYHERELGQLFCDDSARQILDMLLDECADGGVELRLGQRVTGVEKPDGFVVATDHGEVRAGALVLATGGLSIPKMGATGLSHDVARRFGLEITPLYPALVPLTFGPEDMEFMRPLAGVSLEAVVRVGKVGFREALLFTHRGLSGPAILQISSYWRPDDVVAINLLPDLDALAWLKDRRTSRPKAELKTVLGEHLPNRFAEALVDTYCDNGRMADLSNKVLDHVAAVLNDWRLAPAGTEGYRTAEVTLGGIDTKGLSSKTMEAKDCPGLYVVGEAMDVTGWLGGYNFQWAWSSGWCAGMAV